MVERLRWQRWDRIVVDNALAVYRDEIMVKILHFKLVPIFKNKIH